jgi:hypothetical protein
MESQEVMRLSRRAESTRPRASAAAPGPVQAAELLMYVSAGLEIIGGLVAVLTNQEASLLLVFSFAGAGLWAWMARPIRNGRRWARIAGTVLFAANTLATLLIAYAVLAVVSVESEVWVVMASVIRWGLAIVVAVLVWVPESSRYFQHMSRDAGATE